MAIPFYALKKGAGFCGCKGRKSEPAALQPDITDSIYGILTGGDVAERIAGLNRIDTGSDDVINPLENSTSTHFSEMGERRFCVQFLDVVQGAPSLQE